MRCRCDDISILREKISKLCTAESVLLNYSNSLMKLENKIDSANQTIDKLVYCEHAVKVQMALKRKENSFSLIECNFKSKIHSKKTELYGALNDMKSEDELFHAQEKAIK